MQAQVICPNCRSANSNASANCRLCGASLVGASLTGTAPVPAGQAPQSAPPQPQQAYTPAQPTYQPPSYAAPEGPPPPAPQPPSYTQPQQAYPPPSYGYGSPPPAQPQNPYGTSPHYQQPPAYGATPPGGQYPPASPYGQQPVDDRDVHVQIISTQPQQPYWQQPAPAGYYGYTAPYAAPVARPAKGLLAAAFAVATLVGWAIGLPLATWLGGLITRWILQNANSGFLQELLINNPWVLDAVVYLVFGAAVGLVSGILQTIALRIGGIRAGSWPFTSTIGWALGLAIAVPLAGWILRGAAEPGNTLLIGLVASLIVGGIAGLITGAFQIPALSGQAKRAGLWALLSAGTWIVAFCFIALLNNPNLSIFFSPLLEGSALTNSILTGALVGAIGGALSAGDLAVVV